MTGRLRLRWATALPPDRDGGGGAIRQAHLLLSLARHHDIDLVVAGRVPDRLVADAMASITEVPAFVRDTRPSVGRRLLDLRLATTAPFHREVSLHAPVRRAMGAVWNQLPPADVVGVEFAALAPLVEHRGSERWLVQLHNLRSVMAPQLAAITEGSRQRWLLERDAQKALRFEKWVGNAFDLVVVPSQADAARLPRRATVVRNGVDARRFRPTPLPREPRLLFSGALYTGPNIDGARWLATEILPLVRQRVPDAHLDIVGLAPPAEVTELHDLDGVTLHADVKAIQPYLERSRISVVPLRVGSGTRLKALEAMAAGRPVVGTTIGLDGLGLRDGVHALVRDSTVGIADAIVELLGDHVRAAGLVVGARELVEERYDWHPIGDEFCRVVDGLAGAPGK